MLHKRNMDVLRVLLTYPHSPSGTRDRAYISVKPFTAMLQPINILLYLIYDIIQQKLLNVMCTIYMNYCSFHCVY